MIRVEIVSLLLSSLLSFLALSSDVAACFSCILIAEELASVSHFPCLDEKNELMMAFLALYQCGDRGGWSRVLPPETDTQF